jgi:hypothetical protein
MSKLIRVDEETHSDVADIASILNLSHIERNASLGDAVRIAVTDWLKRNRVLLKKVQSVKAEEST